MLDEVTPDTDNVDDTSKQENDGSDGESQNQKLFSGKFKTVDELEKAYKEIERSFGKQGSEIGTLRKELEMTKQMKNITDTLEKISQGAGSKKEEGIDFEEFTAKLSEEFAENPTVAAKKLLAVANSWNLDTEKRTKSEIQQMKDELAKEIRALREEQEKMSPDYQEIKEQVEEVMLKYDLPLAKAKALVKDLRGNVQSKGFTPPSNIGSTRVSSAGKTTKFLSEADREKFMAEGMTKEQLDVWEADEMRRRKMYGGNK